MEDFADMQPPLYGFLCVDRQRYQTRVCVMGEKASLELCAFYPRGMQYLSQGFLTNFSSFLSVSVPVVPLMPFLMRVILLSFLPSFFLQQ